jgi:hypothetical protein
VFNRMNAEIEVGARYLATAKVDVIVYGCTTGSFFKGPGWDREMCGIIQRAAGVPAVATSPSVVEALRAFGARRISVATPYPDWNNEKLRAYLEAHGFWVLNVEGEPRRRLGQPGHQRSGPGVGGRACLASVSAGGRCAPLLVHGVAIRRGRGRDRGTGRRASGHLQPVDDLGIARVLGVTQPVTGFGLSRSKTPSTCPT